MPRLLLLLPTATYRATDFMKAARRAGVEVVVGSERSQALADSMGDRAVVVPFDDTEAAAQAIVDLHGRDPLDGIVAVDDQGVLAAAVAGERLGLPHNPLGAAAATRDKARLRAELRDSGVRQPAYLVVAVDEDIAPAAAEIGFPCVVKPTGLAASQGVMRADDPASLAEAGERARAIATRAGGDPAPTLIVEQFVPGPELAVEGLLRGGRLDVLAVFDKPDPLDGPFFEETLYITPSRQPEAVLGDVEETVARATAAIGLREGPIHAEVRVHDGAIWLLEVAGRSIGGLCSRALRFGAGISLEEVILTHALGWPAGELGRETAASGVMMLPIPRGGVLREVRGVDDASDVEGVVGLEITVPRGRRVEPLPEGDRYLGFLFARGETPAEVEAALRKAHEVLEVVLDD